MTAAGAYQDAWLSGIVAMGFSALIVYIIGKLAEAFPGKSIVIYSQELLGGVVGRVVSLAYLGLFLFMAGTELRIYGEVIKIGFLPETPISVVTGAMVVLAAVVVYAGLEPLGRTADIIFPVFLLMFVANILFPLPQAEFQNLQPVLFGGWMPVIKGAITPVAITAQYANLAMIVPSVEEPHKATRFALLSILFSSLVMVVFAVLVVSVLGADEGARSAFPMFKMIRAVRPSEFLERVEPLTIFAWGLGLFISLSLNLYSGSRGLSELLGMKENRPLILPMSVIWVTFALQGYRDFFEIRQFFTPAVIGPFIFFVLLFPVALLWAAYLLRKVFKENRTGGGERAAK